MSNYINSDNNTDYNNLKNIKKQKEEYTLIENNNENEILDENVVNNVSSSSIKLYNNNIDEIAIKEEQNSGLNTWLVLPRGQSHGENSICYGGGRFVNHVIRALGFSLFAEKFDLYMEYEGKDYIEKLGFKLLSSKC